MEHKYIFTNSDVDLTKFHFERVEALQGGAISCLNLSFSNINRKNVRVIIEGKSSAYSTLTIYPNNIPYTSNTLKNGTNISFGSHSIGIINQNSIWFRVDVTVSVSNSRQITYGQVLCNNIILGQKEKLNSTIDNVSLSRNIKSTQIDVINVNSVYVFNGTTVRIYKI